jgi:hypothetical protein
MIDRLLQAKVYFKLGFTYDLGDVAIQPVNICQISVQSQRALAPETASRQNTKTTKKIQGGHHFSDEEA